MIRVQWSAKSRADIQDFTRWLARQDPRAARNMRQDLFEMVSKLSGRHDIGRPGRLDGTREKSLIKWSKVIVYERTDEILTIVSIIDTRMKPRDEV